MKRLSLSLLALLALPTDVNANFFSGDFVEKTDIDKKYIVKKLTVFKTKSWKSKLEIPTAAISLWIFWSYNFEKKLKAYLLK